MSAPPPSTEQPADLTGVVLGVVTILVWIGTFYGMINRYRLGRRTAA